LQALVQLLELQSFLEKLTHYFKEPRDPFFQKGQRLGFSLALENSKKEGTEQGIEQGKRLVVVNLLNETKFASAGIARLADMPVNLVETIKKDLNA
jgi:hypothetical protein